MGEVFRKESWYSDRRESEGNRDIEISQHLEEMYRLLAKLIETGGDLPGDTKKAIRAQIQAHLAVLGIASLEDYAGLSTIQQRLNEKKNNLPTPPGYPNKEHFGQNLIALYNERSYKNLPNVPEQPLASQVAKFSQSDWIQLEGRGGKSAIDYLYDLGKVLYSKLAYTVTFDSTDPIAIDSQWRVENGRHRALTLKILGKQYVEETGMDDWISIQKEI